MSKRLAILVLIGSAALSSSSKEVVLHPGFATGTSYMALTTDDRESYVAGLIDGLRGASLFSADVAETGWFIKCTNGMTTRQAGAVLWKWFEENPAAWQRSMNHIAYFAFRKECKK